MKNIANRLISVTIYLLGVTIAFATPHPPPPEGKTNGPPSPPGSPIDDNISVLLIFAILLGIYLIYRHQLKTKAPI